MNEIAKAVNKFGLKAPGLWQCLDTITKFLAYDPIATLSIPSWITQSCFRVKAESLERAEFWQHICNDSIAAAGFDSLETDGIQTESFKTKVLHITRATGDIATVLAEFTSEGHRRTLTICDIVTTSAHHIAVISAYEKYREDPERIIAAKDFIEDAGSCAHGMLTYPGKLANEFVADPTPLNMCKAAFVRL